MVAIGSAGQPDVQALQHSQRVWGTYLLKTFLSADHYSDGSVTSLLYSTGAAGFWTGRNVRKTLPLSPNPQDLMLKGLAKQCSALILAPAMSTSLVYYQTRRRCLNHSSWGKPLQGPILARPSGYGMRYVLRQCCLPHEASAAKVALVCGRISYASLYCCCCC